MNKILLILLFALTAAVTYGQRKPVEKPLSKEDISLAKKDANAFFQMKRYAEARDLYQKLVKYESQNTDINYRLGFCMLNSNCDKSKAVDYLEFAAQQKDSPKDTYHQLGLANLHAGAYDAAVEAFEKYKAAMKGKPDPKLQTDLCTEWAYNAKTVTANPITVSFENLGKLVNSPNNDYRPVASVDDSVVFFASTRKGNTGNVPDEFGEGGFTSDVYFFIQYDTARTKPKNPGMNINTAGYEEPMCMSSDGDELYIYVETAEVPGDIMRSTQKGKTWQKVESLGELFTTKDAEMGAAISTDGSTLVFSSDRKDKTAKGGKDLYICKRQENGAWSTPVNMGAPVNTAADDDFPVFFADGKTLFYSSNCNKSIGGYDIFMTSRPDDNSDWSTPVNIGYPLNTVDDNKYISLLPDGKTGYISAVRDSGFGGLDIYKFRAEKPLVQSNLVVVKAYTIVAATGGTTKNARISITKKGTGKMAGEYFTNASTGGFVAVLAPGEYDVAIRTEKLGKFDAILEIPEGGGKVYKLFTLQ
ncbi:MAG: PD40 domain-containing protein [Bacteroidetes bacterium]|nr:PD40 domain-containing protein [Bacteroidota bacterium]